jgi:hypothetical protein
MMHQHDGVSRRRAVLQLRSMQTNEEIQAHHSPKLGIKKIDKV